MKYNTNNEISSGSTIPQITEYGELGSFTGKEKTYVASVSESNQKLDIRKRNETSSISQDKQKFHVLDKRSSSKGLISINVKDQRDREIRRRIQQFLGEE